MVDRFRVTVEELQLAKWLTRGTKKLHAVQYEDDIDEVVGVNDTSYGPSPPTRTWRHGGVLPFGVRLSRAVPVADVASRIDWLRLAAAESTELLSEPEVPRSDSAKSGGVSLDINSGGQVFFGLLNPDTNGDAGKEEAVVLKFCESRHVLQSEQLAAELAWHLGVGAPTSRLMIRAHHSEEWDELAERAAPLCAALGEALQSYKAMLIIQFIPGENFQSEQDAWREENLPASARSLGSLLVLDLLLGNRDRLPVTSLAWRGNPSNVLWSKDAKCVPIDAVVSCKPAGIFSEDDDQIGKCLELALLDRQSACKTLLEVTSCNSFASESIEADWVNSGSGASALPPNSSVKAFNEGVRTALTLLLREQGLLEMVAEAVSCWLDSLHDDPILAEHMPKLPSWQTHWSEFRQKLSLNSKKNETVKERISFWQELLLEKTAQLQQAVDEWAERHEVSTALSFCGFLGPTVLSPMTDARELLLRVRQLVARVKVMAGAGYATRPADLAPAPLFVGPATSADCFHYLRLVGVRLILCCSMDLTEPSETSLGADLKWRRVPLVDIEDQELGEALEEALCAVDECVAEGGKVLVHCHEGKSRSVSLCLAYLLTREKRPLKEGFAFVKSRRRESSPNAGFWKQLLALELETLGSNSMGPEDLPRGKPKGFVCPTCGEITGLTEESLAAHERTKHKGETA
eukprot:TRINITY_DN69124_c0_g1_i1.p1 TRINITY_DN69124_c0_g1~~TRINITY_DN69124_c0_g1_i1.p1  ORF type:complete len:689 (-),score=138.86 TRINITY_DN69124_c0_g1_i1:207-2273(-)